MNFPEKLKLHFKLLPKEYLEYHVVDDEALTMSPKYIDENVVGKTSFDDFVHIEMATLHKADVLVSWNFKHIVNVYRIRGYNNVNLKNGYIQLEIRSPKDVLGYEN